jgi:hypothetical protein
MTKWTLALAAAIAVGVGAIAWPAAEPGKPTGILSCLRVGQSVGLKDAGAAYEITTYAQEVAGPYKVVEIAADHVAVQDLGGLQEIRIPVYAIKSIIHVRR